MFLDVDRRVYKAINTIRTAFRSVLTVVKDGPVTMVNGEGLAGEEMTDVELFQQFGFRSRPPAGTQAVVLPLGGKSSHGVVIATEHGSFSVQQLESGETVVYNEFGAKITLKKDKVIDVECDDFNVLCKKFNVKASDGASFETPVLSTSELMRSRSLNVIGGSSGGSSIHGDLNHTQGSITSNGVVLHTHTHTAPNGQTSEPN